MRPFEAPEPVGDLTAAHRENVLTLTWSHPGSEKNFIKGFVIERAENGHGFVQIASLSPDERRYEDRMFVAGRSYSYRLAAVSKRDRLSDEYALIRVVPQTPPLPPTGLRAVATLRGVEIRWEPVPGLFYNVYKSNSVGQCGSAMLNGRPLQEAIFQDGVDRTSVVYYCVRSLYGGDIGGEGVPSSELSVMPSLYVPAMVEGVRGVASRKGVQLIWRESAEQWVQEYRVWRKGARDADYRLVGTSLVPAWLDTEALSAPASYVVEAVGPVATSTRSAVILVKPFQEP